MKGALAEVDADAGAAATASGERLAYNVLLVAVGAGSEPAFRRVLTWTPETDPELFGGLLRDIDEAYVKRWRSPCLPKSPGRYPPMSWRLALMTGWQAWGMGHDDVQVTIYTPEDAPLGLFGAQATAAVRNELAEAGVEAETGVYVPRIRAVPRVCSYIPGSGRWMRGRLWRCRAPLGPAFWGCPRTPAALCSGFGS